jgi:hypothetical protein
MTRAVLAGGKNIDFIPDGPRVDDDSSACCCRR